MLAHLGVASGHAFAPSLLEIREGADGQLSVRWKTSLLVPSGTLLEPILPGVCERRGRTEQIVEGTGVVQRFALTCPAEALVGAELGVRGLAEARSAGLVRVRLADGSEYGALLQGGVETAKVVQPRAPFAVMRSYGTLGVEHIWTGPDHLLFVWGLILLVSGRRRLLATITAFTVGHSATLALAVLGWIELPSGPVEVAIALSLVVVAAELARGEGERPGWLARSPWLAAAAFGLLHGLGFAGALREVGLPPNEVPLALFAFNLGIEIGQLAFVGGMAVLVIGWHRLPVRFPARWREVGAYAMGSLAAYWCFERGAGLLP